MNKLTRQQQIDKHNAKHVLNQFIKMSAERDALLAQVVILQECVIEAAEQLWNAIGGHAKYITIDEVRRIQKIAEETPNQCLRQIKAEAILGAIEFFKPVLDIDTEALESYAERVRAGTL